MRNLLLFLCAFGRGAFAGLRTLRPVAPQLCQNRFRHRCDHIRAGSVGRFKRDGAQPAWRFGAGIWEICPVLLALRTFRAALQHHRHRHQTGIAAMVKNNGSRTNKQAFWERFSAIYGADRARADQPLFDMLPPSRRRCRPDLRRPLLQLRLVLQLCTCHPDTPQYNSCGTFRNVPQLLSHACPAAACFYGYRTRSVTGE